MTVSSETARRVQYVGAGSTGPYSITFDILDDDHLLVVSSLDSTGAETTLTKTTDYTVSADLTTITLVTALAVGRTLTIKGDTPLTQAQDFADYSKFPAENTEDGLDKLTHIINEQQETISRGITLPISTSITDAETSGEAAEYVLRINEAGTGVEWVAASSVAVAISDIVVDTTPQLGGNLDCNTFNVGFDDLSGITDDSGNYFFKFNKAVTAVNRFDIYNTATGVSPIIAAAGSDTNIDLNLKAKGTGSYHIHGTPTNSAELRFFEDTDNGTNYTGLKAATAITTSTTFTLPSADGTANQVLKTNGSGTLSFTTVTEPGMVWISTTTASASSTVDIDLPTGYTYFELKIVGMIPATDAVDLYVRFRTTGGAVRSGASDYVFNHIVINSTGTVAAGSTGATYIILNQDAGGIDTTLSGSSYNSTTTIYSPRSATLFTGIVIDSYYHVNNNNILEQFKGSGRVTTAESNDRIQLLMSSGNITSGTFILYGFQEV
jgi:hypothetical protein